MYKIMSYNFTVSAPLDLGEPSSFEMVGEPDVLLRPRRVLCNWTEDDSVTVTSFRCGNVEMFVGYPLSITYLDRPIVLRRTVWYRIVRFFKRLFRLAVESDEYRPPLDLPVIGPGIPVRICGRYNGVVPAGMVRGSSYTLMVSILGETRVVGEDSRREE